MPLDVVYKRIKMSAIIDHGNDGLIICFFEPIHVLLLVDPLHLGVLRVVDDQQHHLRLVNQYLQSLQAKLVRIVVNVKHILLVDRLFFGVQFLPLSLVQELNHVFGVYKTPKVK